MLRSSHSDRQPADQTAQLIRNISQRHTPVSSMASVLALGMLLGSGAAQAGLPPVFVNIPVNSTSDTSAVDTNCTLREAIIRANYGAQGPASNPDGCITTANGKATNTISFDPSVTGSITLGGTEIVITKSVAITGPGAGVLSVSGNNASRIFNINAATTTTTTISGLTLTNGNTSGNGGAIYSTAPLTLTSSTVTGSTAGSNGGGLFARSTSTLTNSTVSGNAASYNGGGLFTSDTATLTSSTVSGNTAGYNGGGLYAYNPPTLTNSTVSGNTAGSNGGGLFAYYASTLTNSTVSGNTAGSNGGGLFAFDGTATMINSIIATASGPACGGSITATHSLATDTTCTGATQTTLSALNLGALANNGGPTQTIALLPGSVALKAGDTTTCANAPVSGKDQRGTTRPTACSVGAYDDLSSAAGSDGGGSLSLWSVITLGLLSLGQLLRRKRTS